MTLQIVKDSIDLGIVTTDVEPMLKFYRDTLGLEPKGEMDMPNGGKMTRLKCGTTTIKLVVHAKEPKVKAAPGGIGGATGYRYWTITVANIEEAAAACKEAGYNVVVPVVEFKPGTFIAIIEDPDGNSVELLQG